MAVLVRNNGKDVYVDRCAGEEYRIPPGMTIAIPDRVAKLWLGDWTLPEPLRRHDEERAAFRRAGRPSPLVRVEENGEVPAPNVELPPPPDVLADGDRGDDTPAPVPDDLTRVCPVCQELFTDPRAYGGHIGWHKRKGEWPKELEEAERVIRMYRDAAATDLVRDDVNPGEGTPDSFDGPASGGAVQAQRWLFNPDFATREYVGVDISGYQDDTVTNLQYAADEGGSPGPWQEQLFLPDGDYQTPHPIWVRVVFAPTAEPILRTDVRHRIRAQQEILL